MNQMSMHLDHFSAV